MIETVLNHEDDSIDMSSITENNNNNNHPPIGQSIIGEKSSIQFVGRLKEIVVLEDAFDSLQNNRQQISSSDHQTSFKRNTVFHRSIVFVHGSSGSGKTTLVEHSLRQLTTNANGFFITGKFEANSCIREPHAAIFEALSDLCDLTIQSMDLDERRRNMHRIMGRHSVRLLEHAISNLMTIWDMEMETPSEPYDEDAEYNDQSYTNSLSERRNASAFAQFMVACSAFLEAMSSREHSIVFFMDDIQWMDQGSKQLLSYFLNDNKITNIMFVLAYRDEDEGAISEFLQETSMLPNVLDIQLYGLDSLSVCSLISSLIHASVSSLQDLSNVITTKTRGNPFLVLQILEEIHKQGLMTCNIHTSEWEFNVDKIQQKIMVPDTLAIILEQRLQRLPTNVQESLKIASLIGYRFDEEILRHVLLSLSETKQIHTMNIDPSSDIPVSLDSVASSLRASMKDGFIERTREGYQFSHDKLQLAFLSMIDSPEKDRYHVIIGEAYLARGNAESTYHAAVHLQQAPSYATTESSRLELAYIHLKAAKYCNKMSAFQDAAELLHHGLELLNPKDKWTKHYDVTFQLTGMLSKMELIIGNHESCKAKAQEVLSMAITTKSKVNALMIHVECCMACNEMDATIVAANQALTLLGVTIPKKITIRHVIMKLIQVKLMLGRKSDDYILNLPKMNDESMATTVRLLLHLYMYCLLKSEDLQGLYSALLATELTLRGGLNPYAASAFTIYGFAELSNGNYRQAYRFGKLAILLLDKFKNRDAECPTIGLALTSLTHWFDPIRDMPPRFLQAANRGFEIGDIVYGTFCISMCYGMQIVLGENLEQLETFFRSTYQRIRDLSQDAMIMWAQPALQFVLNLRNRSVDDWRDLTNLTGEIMNESTFLQQAIESDHRTLIMIAWAYKAQISCIFGQWAKAESIYKDMISLSESFYFSYAVMISSLYGGIASYSLYKENKSRKHLNVARRHRKFLNQAHIRGCPNAFAFLTLLNAEDISFKQSMAPNTVIQSYDIAIATMSTENLPNFEALARERAGYYAIQCGNRILAKRYFDPALELYKNTWGALAKHDWLVETIEKKMSRLPP